MKRIVFSRSGTALPPIVRVGRTESAAFRVRSDSAAPIIGVTSPGQFVVQLVPDHAPTSDIGSDRDPNQMIVHEGGLGS